MMNVAASLDHADIDYGDQFRAGIIVPSGNNLCPNKQLRNNGVQTWRNQQPDDGAVVRALARDGEHFARCSAGTAEIAVVEGDGDEALLTEALSEWSQSSRLDAPDAVGLAALLDQI